MVWWMPGAAAGISAAADIAGGFLSRPDHSERDLMWENVRTQEYQLRTFPTLQMEGLRRAGLNPMLAMMKGNVQGSSSGSIPARMEDPVGRSIGRAASSAIQAYRAALEMERVEAETDNIKETNRQIRAQTENIAANTNYVTAKTATEIEQPGLIISARELNSAKTDMERQRLQREIVETAIKKEELTIAEKDAIVAAIDIDMYESTVGEVSRWLQNLGIQPKAAVGMAHMFWSFFRTKRSK